ncbi:hypothetical protein GCM10017562_00030 [Streptomyces roseofulvus]|uniref:hypothetical protein n=1 Tax=Streptomyces roseofulvus TaxID=33902 RepID=UPI0031FA33FA
MGQWQERQEQSEDNIRMASRAAAAENARALSNNAVPPLVRQVARPDAGEDPPQWRPVNTKDLKSVINGASDLKLWNGSGGAGGKSGLFESALRVRDRLRSVRSGRGGPPWRLPGTS